MKYTIPNHEPLENETKFYFKNLHLPQKLHNFVAKQCCL